MYRKILVFILAAVAVFLFLNPEGRRFLSSIKTGLAASAASSNERYELEVLLEYDGGRTFDWNCYVDRSIYKDAEMIGYKAVKDKVVEARKALAASLGYDPEIYGDDNEKLQCCKVREISITDHRSNRTVRVDPAL